MLNPLGHLLHKSLGVYVYFGHPVYFTTHLIILVTSFRHLSNGATRCNQDSSSQWNMKAHIPQWSDSAIRWPMPATVFRIHVFFNDYVQFLSAFRLSLRPILTLQIPAVSVRISKFHTWRLPLWLTFIRNQSIEWLWDISCCSIPVLRDFCFQCCFSSSFARLLYDILIMEGRRMIMQAARG